MPKTEEYSNLEPVLIGFYQGNLTMLRLNEATPETLSAALTRMQADGYTADDPQKAYIMIEPKSPVAIGVIKDQLAIGPVQNLITECEDQGLTKKDIYIGTIEAPHFHFIEAHVDVSILAKHMQMIPSAIQRKPSNPQDIN